MPVLPLVGSTTTARPGPDLPRLLGGVDHRHPDPVLDRAAGVEVLELGADVAAEALGEPVEQDHRRAADDS